MTAGLTDEVGPPPAPVLLAPLVGFWVDQRRCAISVEVVREVVRVEQLTRVPHAPRHIRGMAPLHGRPVPVIDAGVLLGRDPIAVDGEARILILEAGERPLGLLVSRTATVIAAPEGDVQVLELAQLLEAR
jgi:purine-binding chemotaxis protein CheW